MQQCLKPVIAITIPERMADQHQSLLHVGAGGWSDEKMLSKEREPVRPKIERYGPIEAWIIHDIGFPKKECHSVRVDCTPGMRHR